MYAADIGMRNLAGDAYLVIKARRRAIVVGQRFGQKCQSDGLAGREVSSFVYITHDTNALAAPGNRERDERLCRRDSPPACRIIEDTNLPCDLSH